MKLIKEISSLETISVRHSVLRKGMPIESCKFNGDELNSTTHFGFFENNKIIGVVSLYETKNGTFFVDKQIQIRGMAVLESHQKKGIGNALIKHCEDFATSKKITLIWFNARENAILFYDKMGYKTLGDPFEIDSIGTHYLMFKRY